MENFNFEVTKYQSEEEVMDYDLFHIEHSDFIIVNAEGLDTSIGTQFEIFDAWQYKKPVFVFGKYSNTHPWLLRCITRIDKNMDETVKYIKELYCI